MPHFKINPKSIFFILKDQLNYGSLCALPRYKGLSEKSLDMAVKEAVTFAKKVLEPLQDIGEQNKPKIEKGNVTCPEEFKEAFKKYGEDGWIAAARDTTYGGQGFPHMMRIVINDIMYGACQSFNMAPSLTHGAAHLIESFASDDLKKLFIPKCYAGQWSGTMCLTEAEAGSNLANIKTTAVREGNHFKIKGQKIFISWGDHNLTENIIHLLLARIEGAPPGLKGISLFIVPKYNVNDDGSVGTLNDVICRNIENKLGLHGSPTCTLEFGANDQCTGFLCGQENMGLSHMFQMMNSARINTGVSGMAIASSAYLNALEYTKNRVQGKDIVSGQKEDVTIINHPDIRRMLLFMKASVDGMRSMIYTAALWADMASELPDSEEKVHYQNLTDFMTPIIKAYCSDVGFRVCETAIQCLGGYGYCKDFPLEQYLRDIKILSLYEGTNGIQSIDLMGRKMVIHNSAPFKAFRKEILSFCSKHISNKHFENYIKDLKNTVDHTCNAALEMTERRKENPLQWASATYPALLCFGELIAAWRLLDMGIIAEKNKKSDFNTGKIMQATYYTDTVLPHTRKRIDSCLRTGGEIENMPENAF
jgi:alkylation response protein AidB-like acyl-CoA dehydrogenase